MKVLFCNNVLSGLLKFRRDIIEDFSQRGCDIIIVVPYQSDSKTLLGKLDISWKIYQTGLQRNSINPFSDLKFIYELYRIYKKEKPDLVFNYTVKPNIYGSIVSRFCGIKNVAMVAGLGYLFDGNSLKKRIGLALYRIGLRNADRVIALNSSNRDVLINRNFVKSERLITFKGGEGVNLADYPYKRMSFSGVRFLMVARLLYDKGYTEYVEAAKIVKQKHPDVQFELLGSLAEDSPMGVPEAIVRSDDEKGVIKYLGVTNDVQSYVLRDDVVVVLPSKYLEGLNRSLMEACSMGRPIITTINPGCQETVDEGINGYLVSPGNAEELADALIRFIELPRNAKIEMSEASFEKAVSTFDIKLVIQEYRKIANDFLNRKF